MEPSERRNSPVLTPSEVADLADADFAALRPWQFQPMSWISDSIAIGKRFDTTSAEYLQAEGIQAVLSLDESPADQVVRDLGLEAHSYRLIDGAGNSEHILLEAVDRLRTLAESYERILVHCHAGRSRSVVVVAAYLAEELNLKLSQAVELIAAKREINPSAELLDTMQRALTR